MYWTDKALLHHPSRKTTDTRIITDAEASERKPTRPDTQQNKHALAIRDDTNK